MLLARCHACARSHAGLVLQKGEDLGVLARGESFLVLSCDAGIAAKDGRDDDTKARHPAAAPPRHATTPRLHCSHGCQAKVLSAASACEMAAGAAGGVTTWEAAGGGIPANAERRAEAASASSDPAYPAGSDMMILYDQSCVDEWRIRRGRVIHDARGNQG